MVNTSPALRNDQKRYPNHMRYGHYILLRTLHMTSPHDSQEMHDGNILSIVLMYFTVPEDIILGWYIKKVS